MNGLFKIKNSFFLPVKAYEFSPSGGIVNITTQQLKFMPQSKRHIVKLKGLGMLIRDDGIAAHPNISGVSGVLTGICIISERGQSEDIVSFPDFAKFTISLVDDKGKTKVDDLPLTTIYDQVRNGKVMEFDFNCDLALSYITVYEFPVVAGLYVGLQIFTD